MKRRILGILGIIRKRYIAEYNMTQRIQKLGIEPDKMDNITEILMEELNGIVQ